LTGGAGPQGLRGTRGYSGAAGSRGATGSQGASGPVGPAGSRGLQGVQGNTGAPGLRGPIGVTGSDGTNGKNGTNGIDGTGTNGKNGTNGIDGTDGKDGTNGKDGPNGGPGRDGPAGPPGGLAEYAYVFNTGAQTVATGAAVTFDSNGVSTPGITHAAGTPGAAGIVLANSGTYKVAFSASGVGPIQMALYVDNVLVDGTTYGSGAGTQQNTGQGIVVVPAGGGVLTLKDHTSSGAVALETRSGGTATNANASVLIEKIA
jgi:hypothetical protein